uniref:Etoposide-induced protein 2.4 n=1 Tax=Spongospora subterranea TaxID=70186 RepID=A0A0H5RE58_9EUKA|eukprot:CRZ11827.1 hypothetical protein [Spongospora subterranea]
MDNGDTTLQHVPVQKSFVSGLIDALSFHNVAIFLFVSRTVRKNMLQCAALNILIFVGSIMLMDNLIMPIIRGGLGQVPSGGFIIPLIEKFYCIFWIWPVYYLSFLFNSIWYQSIAEMVFAIRGVPAVKPGTSLNSFANEAFRVLLLGCVFSVVLLLSFLPMLGRFIWLIALTWLYSFYMWEYKWTLQGWSIESRVTFFQRRWPYFLGFGFPAMFVTVIWPSFITHGFIAFIFPCFIILAIIAPTPRPANFPRDGLPIFMPSVLLASKLLKAVQQKINQDLTPRNRCRFT